MTSKHNTPPAVGALTLRQWYYFYWHVESHVRGMYSTSSCHSYCIDSRGMGDEDRESVDVRHTAYYASRIMIDHLQQTHSIGNYESIQSNLISHSIRTRVLKKSYDIPGHFMKKQDMLRQHIISRTVRGGGDEHQESVDVHLSTFFVWQLFFNFTKWQDTCNGLLQSTSFL